MTFVKVNFYSAEVKYTGRFEDYSFDDLLEMAKARVDKGVDIFDHCEVMPEASAKEYDGKITSIKDFPCNRLCRVEWAYIAEDDEDDEEEDEGYCPYDPYEDRYEDEDPITCEGYRQQDLIDSYRRER